MVCWRNTRNLWEYWHHISDDAALHEKIAQLRAQGHAVIIDFLGAVELRSELNCDSELVMRDGEWHVVKIKF